MLSCSQVTAQEPIQPQRCEVLPLPQQQASMTIDGREILRWHWHEDAPRPFLFPYNGPSGVSLTRMGHPGAENHDHHRSIWFAHHDVNGESYWTESSQTRIRQKFWYTMQDGPEEAVLAVALDWIDSQQVVVLNQDLVLAIRPLPNGEHALEIDSTFRTPAAQAVRFGKTNFGFLAVRVAKTISEHFGGGKLTNSHLAVGENDIFAKRSQWVDYSGPIGVGEGPTRTSRTEGLTYFDHPNNPGFPSSWHVRRDGWMSAAFCLEDGFNLTPEEPLQLRYLIYAHHGDHDPMAAKRIFDDFAARPSFKIHKSSVSHQQYEVQRSPVSSN